jgi:glucan phosphoethanolaminetransferase (alkaline phosphatase superfamily)
MTGLFSKYIFAFLWTLGFFLFVRRILIQKKKLRFVNVLLVFYILTLIAIISLFIIDFKEYNSFNKIELESIKEIYVSGKQLSKKDFNGLIKELKQDEFTWVNHPNVTKKDTITILTIERKYLFSVEITSNQGILINRINENGKGYVTNRNDKLLDFIK